MISMNWVKDYIDLENEDLEQLASKVTKAGINVEHVITNKIDNLVIGEVKDVENHPDSDHLNICKVDIGNELLQIVCGAPNVRVGLKVIVAKVGAKLPEMTIKKSTVRGVESNGMLCALFELGLEEKTEKNYNKGICELGSDAKVGEDPLAYLNLDDTLYDLDVHKHKNNDCLYHIGFAYEIGTIIGKKVKLPESNYKEIDKSIKDEFTLEVNTDKCTYYKAKMATNLKIKESPDFIKKRLISAGMRPINNVVDISNYVMLEYGQPLHFFDKDKLGSKILVRMAKPNEEVVTLDDEKRILNENDIVITDGNKVVAIAGVMGALNTEVEDSTKTLLIESAIFNPYSIRKTEKHLNLRSEASMRYEKGLNYEYTDAALDRACHLLEKYADATIYKDYVLHDTEDKKEKIISFKKEKINSLLGLDLTDEDIVEELDKLDFEYKKEKDLYTVKVPRRRLDIEENVNDIAEEIGRLYGYHNLKNTLPILPTKKGEYRPELKFKKEVNKRLRVLGLNEVKTYSIVDKNNQDMFNNDLDLIILPNPMSQDKTALRKTLIPSLLDTYRYNKARGVKNINIFEISNIFYGDFKEKAHVGILMYGNYITSNWQKLNIKDDFYVLKGIVEKLLDYLGFKNRYSFEVSNEKNLHPGISADILLDREKIGFMGRIHPSIEKKEVYVLEMDLSKLNIETKGVKYKASSMYPSIKKDLAFVIPKEMSTKEVETAIKKSGGRLLKNIEVFDLYEGENISNTQKSIAYSLTFESDEKTLTDDEVNTIFNNIIEYVKEKLKIDIRK